MRCLICSVVGNNSIIFIPLYVATLNGDCNPSKDHLTSVSSISLQINSPTVGLSSSSWEIAKQPVSFLYL